MIPKGLYHFKEFRGVAVEVKSSKKKNGLVELVFCWWNLNTKPDNAFRISNELEKKLIPEERFNELQKVKIKGGQYVK